MTKAETKLRRLVELQTQLRALIATEAETKSIYTDSALAHRLGLAYGIVRRLRVEMEIPGGPERYRTIIMEPLLADIIRLIADEDPYQPWDDTWFAHELGHPIQRIQECRRQHEIPGYISRRRDYGTGSNDYARTQTAQG